MDRWKGERLDHYSSHEEFKKKKRSSKLKDENIREVVGNLIGDNLEEICHPISHFHINTLYQVQIV